MEIKDGSTGMAAAEALAAFIAANGPTADELERAKSVLQADFLLLNNPQLIDMLFTNENNQPLTAQRRNTLLPEVSASDVRDLATNVMPVDARVEVITLPSAN